MCPTIPTTTTPIHEGNGQVLPVPGGEKPRSAFAAYLRERVRNDVLIGSRLYVPGQEDDTGSFADLAEQISGIAWLVPDWIPFGMLTGLLGHSKVGKSLWALWCIVRPIVTGCSWFSGLPGPEPAHVLWADTERRAGINLKRAKDWGLPMDRILTPFADPLRALNLDSETDIDRVFSVICRYKAKAVIVDSFRGAHRGDENSSRIVGPLDRLASIAEQTKAGVLLIHHTGKMQPGQEITVNSARGSSAFLAAVACQIVLDQPDAKSPCRRFRVLGENLGTAPRPLGFTISDCGLEITEAPDRNKPPTVKDKAREWLLGRMEPGKWYKALTLIEEAKQFGFSGNALQRAREELGVTLETGLIRQNADDKYEWTRGST